MVLSSWHRCSKQAGGMDSKDCRELKWLGRDANPCRFRQMTFQAVCNKRGYYLTPTSSPGYVHLYLHSMGCSSKLIQFKAIVDPGE